MVADTVFIFSAGHSGSTLLDLMIGAHPRVASLGEITYLPRFYANNRICSCNLTASECPFWGHMAEHILSEMGVDVRQSPYDLDLGPMHDKSGRLYQSSWKLLKALFLARAISGAAFLDPLLGKLYRSIDRNFALFDLVRREADVDIVVDSSKSYFKGLAMYSRASYRVKAILLSRDGRGVFRSGIRRGLSRQTALNKWKLYYAHALPLIKKSIRAEDCLRIRYEELVSDPAGWVSRISDFLGLPPFHGDISSAARVQHMPVGNNPSRRRGLSDIKLDDAWRRELGAEELAFFEREAGALNRRLGHR